MSNAQGRVQFTTYQPGDGVHPGEYRVIVSKSANSIDEEFKHADLRDPEVAMRMQMRQSLATSIPHTAAALPRAYLSADTTPLSCSVSAEGDNRAVFTIETKFSRSK
jgi:hypothetical protein